MLVALLFISTGCDEMTPNNPVPVKLENLHVADGYIVPKLTVTLRNTSTKPIRAVSFWVKVVDGHGDVVHGLGSDVARMRWQPRHDCTWKECNWYMALDLVCLGGRGQEFRCLSRDIQRWHRLDV